MHTCTAAIQEWNEAIRQVENKKPVHLCGKEAYMRAEIPRGFLHYCIDHGVEVQNQGVKVEAIFDENSEKELIISWLTSGDYAKFAAMVDTDEAAMEAALNA